jgi:hypothetical protein
VIIIDTILKNNGVIQMNNISLEYSSPIELDSTSGNYFVIPSSIILAQDVNEKRTTVFSYFSIRRGLDSKLLFSVNNLVKWIGKKPDRHANGINNKIVQVIEYLKDNGYLTPFEEVTSSSFIEAKFNLSKISQECEHNRFAVIYLDELDKILSYNIKNSKDTYLNVDVILLVFAYLRMMIYRRRNRLLPEEVNLNNKNDHNYDISERRLRSPDAYDCYYYEIAEDLGLSARIISKVVEILNELDLIYSEELPRIKYKDKWRTDHTIFCNTYKREGNLLLISGKNYYMSEVENKKKKLNIISNKKVV